MGSEKPPQGGGMVIAITVIGLRLLYTSSPPSNRRNRLSEWTRGGRYSTWRRRPTFSGVADLSFHSGPQGASVDELWLKKRNRPPRYLSRSTKREAIDEWLSVVICRL